MNDGISFDTATALSGPKVGKANEKHAHTLFLA